MGLPNHSQLGMLPVHRVFEMKVNMDSTLASQYRAFPSNTTLYAPLRIQVWGQFDNYLLTSVILIAVAIILLMLYISCYAWVFRGNLDLPKPTKAFSIKGRSDSFKPARQGDVILDPDTLFPLDMENTSNIILLN